MSLFSIETMPVPLDAETYIGEKRKNTHIILETELIALTENNYIPLTQENKIIFRSIDPRDVRSNLNMHLSDIPFTIRQPIQRPRLLERVYKPICTLH